MNRPQTFVELLCDGSLSAASKKYIPHMINVCMPEIGYFQLSAKELGMATSNYARMLKPLFDRNIIKKVPANKYTYDDQPLSKGYVFNPDLLVPKDYEKASQLWAKL